MKKPNNIFIAEKLYECDRHEEKIQIAKKNLSTLIPLSEEKYCALNDVDVSFIDQLIFRFSKLQDSLGEKIFPAILILSGEEVKKKTKPGSLNCFRDCRENNVFHIQQTQTIVLGLNLAKSISEIEPPAGTIGKTISFFTTLKSTRIGPSL